MTQRTFTIPDAIVPELVAGLEFQYQRNQGETNAAQAAAVVDPTELGS
jgi:hypothetical protein